MLLTINKIINLKNNLKKQANNMSNVVLEDKQFIGKKEDNNQKQNK